MKVRVFPFLLLTLLTFPAAIGENIDSYRGLASSWNIIPSRSLAGLHYIFKGYQIDEDESLAKVTGPVIQITSGETLGGQSFSRRLFK
jgi:hypothetical protein